MEKTIVSTDNMWKRVLDQVQGWSRLNSPWAVHFNSGSCNGCDIEILATLTPRYDVERFGIKLKGSPRHADVLIATGPVTRQARERLLRVYEQMPAPKFVVAVGTRSIYRFARPVCFQSFPDALVPAELQAANPLGIMRLVDVVQTRDPLSR